MATPVQSPYIIWSDSPMFNYSINVLAGFATGDCKGPVDGVLPAFCSYPGYTNTKFSEQDSNFIAVFSVLQVSYGPFSGDRLDLLAGALTGTCHLTTDIIYTNGTVFVSNSTTLRNDTFLPLSLPNLCQDCYLHLLIDNCSDEADSLLTFGGVSVPLPAQPLSVCDSQVQLTGEWQEGTRQEQVTGSCASGRGFIPRWAQSDRSSMQLRFNGSGITVVGSYGHGDGDLNRTQYSIVCCASFCACISPVLPSYNITHFWFLDAR